MHGADVGVLVREALLECRRSPGVALSADLASSSRTKSLEAFLLAPAAAANAIEFSFSSKSTSSWSHSARKGAALSAVVVAWRMGHNTNGSLVNKNKQQKKIYDVPLTQMQSTISDGTKNSSGIASNVPGGVYGSAGTDFARKSWVGKPLS